MAYKIIWSPEAEKTFNKIVEYLDTNWSENEIITLVSKLEKVISFLRENPYLFRSSEKENIHEVLITKHNLLLYQINIELKTVELLNFWDTRQHQNKKLKRK